MSDTGELLLRLLLIVNPLAALLVWSSLSAPLVPRTRPRLGALAVGLAFVGLALAALLADRLLDLLSVSPPTWQMAAGALLIFAAFPVFLARDPFLREPYGSERTLPRWAVARLACGLANPAALAALVVYGAEFARGPVLIALFLVLVLTGAGVARADALERRVGRLPLREGGRVLAALLVLMSVAMIVDAVNSV